MALAQNVMLNGVLDALQQKKTLPVGVAQQQQQTMQMPQQPPQQAPASLGGVPQNFWTPGVNGGNAQFNMPQSVLQAVQAGAGGGQGGLPGGGAPGLRGGNPTDSNLQAPPAKNQYDIGADVGGRLGLPADPISQGISNSLSKAVGFNINDPLGIFHQKAKDSYNIWGTPQQNAANAQAGDYNAYMNANADLMPAYEKLQASDPRGYDHMLKSFDLNGNKKLEPGEYGQWHYQNAGKKEGRALTPVAGMQPRQAPTLQQLQSGRGGVLGYLGG